MASIHDSGSGGYRADQAHGATQHRARRRKPSPIPAAPAATGGYGRDPDAVRDFEELLTTLLVQMGLPRMIARVLTCLSTTDTGSLTSAELVQRLQVSPASISKAVSYLEGQQLVRREHDGFRRRERYIVDDDFWYRAWIASAQTNATLAQAARRGAEILGTATPAGGRLADMGQFLEHVGADMVQRAEYWRDAFSARPPADN